MVFLSLIVSILVITGYATFSWLIIPASTNAKFILDFHILIFAAAAFSLIRIIKFRASENRGSYPKLYRICMSYFFIFLGIDSILFFASLCAALANIALSISFSSPPNYHETALFALAFAYILIALNIFIALKGAALTSVNINSSDESSNAQNYFKILHITDLHIGALIGEKYINKILKIAEITKPDCIVFTGDIGDGDPQYYKPAIDALGKFRAANGVFISLGNHELYHKPQEWISQFKKINMKVLVDESALINFHEKTFRIAGVAPYGNAARIENLIPKNDQQKIFNIILSHYPDRADEAASAGADLYLAGHTHGGQFFPWSLVIRFFHKYAKGYYKIGQMHAYISRGAGFWGPPFRFGARAEVTLFKIKF